MRQYSESEYTRGMIQGLIKIQEDILKNPDLSIEQKDDITKLRQQLDTLSLQTDDLKLKLELIDIMNRLG
jgi:hypothetical protein